MNQIEPYRMVEPQTLTDAQLRAIPHNGQPPIANVLSYAFWWVVGYGVVVALLLM